MEVLSRTANDPPITLAEAKAHLRVDGDDENPLITNLILAARDAVETATCRALVRQTRRLVFDRFRDEPQRWEPFNRLTLWGGKVPAAADGGSVTVKYLDGALVEQTVDPALYRLISPSHDEVAFLVPRQNGSWPATATEPRAVTVDYVVGYGLAATSVPQQLRQAMLLHIGHSFEHRETPDSPAFQQAFERLVSAYRLFAM